jgi:hypothetical protein
MVTWLKPSPSSGPTDGPSWAAAGLRGRKRARPMAARLKRILLVCCIEGVSPDST